MSTKARRSASAGSSGRPRKPYRQRCAVRVIYSQNKTRGQWKAHGRYLMREAATRNGEGRGAFDQDEQAKNLVATLDDWQKSGDKRLFKFIISPEFGDRVNLERLTRDLMTRMWWPSPTSTPGVHTFMLPCGGEEPTVRPSC